MQKTQLDEQSNPEQSKLTNNYLIINGSLLGLLFIIIGIKIVFLIKSMKEKKLNINLSTMISYLIQKTIFIYLDNLDLQAVETQSRKNTDQQKKSQSKELRAFYEYDGTIICNCYDCFCEGCPWHPCQEKCSKVCCSCVGSCCVYSENCWDSLQTCYQDLQNKFLSILKYVIYFITKPYFYMIFNSFFINTSQGAFITFGIIFYSLHYYVLFFTSSFFSTKREMMRLEDLDRGSLLYYHLRKAFIYTLFLILLYLFCILALAITFNKMDTSQPDCIEQFVVYNSIFLMMGSLLQFVLLTYNPFKNNTDLIQDNDHILKAQQRLYIMQNNLIKYFPSQERFYEQVQEKNFNDKEIEKYMNEKKIEADYNLKLSFQANSKQKFKKIKKNLGQNKTAIGIVSFWLYIITLSTFICSIGFFCEYYLDYQESLDPQNKNNFPSINSKFIAALFWFQFTNNLILPIVLPFFFDKKDLFGQDYGGIN